MISDAKRAELQRNYVVFLNELPRLLRTHEGQYALMRHGEIVEYFDNAQNALRTGRQSFADEIFSVQEVTSRKADLGWYSRVPTHPPL